MTELLHLKIFTDKLNCLNVIKKVIPLHLKRVLYINAVTDSNNDKYRYYKIIQAAICIKNWHMFYSFSDSILIACALKYFNKKDYIFNPYKK